MKLKLFLNLIATLLLVFVARADAALALQGRDIKGNPVAANDASAVFEYDPNLNLTWLRDWNLGRGSVYDNGGSTTDGRMTGDNANAWAQNLSYGGFAGWFLPTTADPDYTCSYVSYGTGCLGSQMGFLWYVELGNTAGSLSNAGPFLNMPSGYWYWSSTEKTSPGYFFVFNVINGYQSIDNGNGTGGSELFAIAVRLGDVYTAASNVAEPSSFVLIGLGLAGLAFARRRKDWTAGRLCEAACVAGARIAGRIPSSQSKEPLGNPGRFSSRKSPGATLRNYAGRRSPLRSRP